MQRIDRSKLLDIVGQLKNDGFDYLLKITAVDYKDHLEVDYILMNIDENRDEFLKVDLKNDDAWVPSINNIFMAADWHEREMSEMFGIRIVGREARRLLIEKWDGADPPLRKSFEWNKPYKSLD